MLLLVKIFDNNTIFTLRFCHKIIYYRILFWTPFLTYTSPRQQKYWEKEHIREFCCVNFWLNSSHFPHCLMLNSKRNIVFHMSRYLQSFTHSCSFLFKPNKIMIIGCSYILYTYTKCFSYYKMLYTSMKFSYAY